MKKRTVIQICGNEILQFCFDGIGKANPRKEGFCSEGVLAVHNPVSNEGQLLSADGIDRSGISQNSGSKV